MWRTVWAEDGALFYTDALHHPLREIALRPYAGICAARAPHARGRSVFTFRRPGTRISRPSRPRCWRRFSPCSCTSPAHRYCVHPSGKACWPRRSCGGRCCRTRSRGVIANTHWVMVVPCLLAVLMPVDRPWAIAVRVPIVVIAPLSSPLCVLFVPIALWHGVRYVRHRTPWTTLVVPGIYTVAAATQVIIWHFAEKVPGTDFWGSVRRSGGQDLQHAGRDRVRARHSCHGASLGPHRLLVGRAVRCRAGRGRWGGAGGGLRPRRAGSSPPAPCRAS